MAVELKCIDEGHANESWFLNVQGPVGVLTTSAGERVARFSLEEASRRFRLPGLLDTDKRVTIVFEQQDVHFEVSAAGIKQIEDFLNRNIAAPPAAAAVRAGDVPAFVKPPRVYHGRTFFAALKIILALVAAVFVVVQSLDFVDVLIKGASNPRVYPAAIGTVVVGTLISVFLLRSALTSAVRRPVSG